MSENVQKNNAIRLTVDGWPFIGRSSRFSLDPVLVPDQKRLQSFCRNRFGEGRLIRLADDQYEYRLTSSLPAMLKSLFTGLLNKSY